MDLLPSKSKIVHIEPDPLWQRSVKDLVSHWPRLSYEGFATTGERGFELCKKCRPDLALLEIDLPDTDGFKIAENIAALPAPPRIILVTRQRTVAVVFYASRPFVGGLIWKVTFDGFPETLNRAITEVLAGRVFHAPDVEEACLVFRRDPRAFAKILSNAELKLLPYFASGLTDSEIATRIGISAGTVKCHRHGVMEKLNLEGTPQLMRWAFERGFSPLRPAPPCIAPP